jgi:hypothetical protein
VSSRHAVTVLALAIFGAVAGFCALEGSSSLILFVGKVVTFRVPTFNERLHTAYDPELGWVGRPSVTVPDMYGPGIGLTTNAQGFRAAHDVAREAPKDRLRIVCSGDSFTLGYGVADDRPWCARLAALDPRFETVNLGQGGYGLDQAYLWYVRSGHPLEHAVEIFALITGDFYRMPVAVFLGHGKPTLAVEQDRLVTHGVPVPPTPSRFPFLSRRLSVAARDLRFSQLLARIPGLGWNASTAAGGDRFDESTWTVAAKIFESLHAMSRERQRTLVVLYLPTEDDYGTAESDRWRDRLQAEATALGFVFVDLVPEFRELPPRTMRSMLIPAGSAGTGHYSNAGHEWVADRLHRRLEAIAEVRAGLARRGAARHDPKPTGGSQGDDEAEHPGSTPSAHP